ncbi:LysR substrate-binding domain-containing protein [Bradyrhizobium elkanii]|uniref:LysR substrate-binding domain-containing protein n=1 Tax=Bradyrhizobium elkanii TaxID=29448 RepID=UPI0020A0E1E3|nr:DNA-binding transcriptional LysR family regulator [Bradyrhizobium elkanii]
MTVELRHLRYAIAAADHGSFRRAARTLSVEESTLSRRIRDLEDELGAALFIRRASGVHLTHAGQCFLGHARRAVREVAHAVVEVGAIGRGETGAVRVGIFSSLASGFLAALLREYLVRHPDVRTDVIEGGPSGHLAAVRQHQTDIAFLTGEQEVEGCDRLHLWDERVLVAMRSEHPFSNLAAVSWEHLRDERFLVSEADPGPEIHDYLVKHLAALGHHPSVERHGVSRDNLMNLVAIGGGLTLTSEATVGTKFPGVVYKPLAGEVLPFCAFWSPRNDNPALRRMLSLAKIMSKRSKGLQQPGRRAPADERELPAFPSAASAPNGCGSHALRKTAPSTQAEVSGES